MNDYFTLALRDGIATLQLNRPERLNTLEPAFFPALRNAVRALHDDAGTRVLVISSTGRHFSAGLALEVFDELLPDAGDDTAGGGPGRERRDPALAAQREAIGALLKMLDTSTPRARMSFQESLQRLVDCFDALDEARFPVICVVQGGCVGSALDLAAACDLRVCSADAFFSVQETQIGLMANPGVLQRLPRLLPPAVAREMAFTGDRVDAARALATGLVNAVLADADAALAHAMALAQRIAAKSPLAVSGCKLALNHVRDHGTAASRQQMALLQTAIFDTQEVGAAIADWKARRDSSFDPLAPVARI